MKNHRVVLGLGSNLGDRLATFRAAIELLASGQTPILTGLRSSEVFESEALLLPGSPTSWNLAFLNIAVAGDTKLSALELLNAIKQIELKLGRQNRERWAPREIDIDILVFGTEQLSLPDLKIPHPALLDRPFALWPLSALIAGYRVASTKWGAIRAEIPCRTWRAPHQIHSQFVDLLRPLNIPVIAGPLAATELVGVLNITPDSFSDGGLNIDPVRAVTHARELFYQGAAILDIGAESTRPDAKAISTAEEWSRLAPVFEQFKRSFSDDSLRPTISIDTRNPEVAQFALAAGASWLNDVTGFDNPVMQEIAAAAKCEVVAMHSLGVPPSRDRVLDQEYCVMAQLLEWGEARIEQLERAGIARQRIILDPGIGFGKTPEQSLEIILRADELHKLKVRILIGHSRKSFLNIFSTRPAAERDGETGVLSAMLASNGVHYLRVHNVAINARSLVRHPGRSYCIQ